MNFEKALEAMKQGKKVRRKIYSAYEYWFYNSDFDRVIVYDGENYRDFGVKPVHDMIESRKDDWEIYEEPEMTAEKAKKILRVVRTESILCNKYFEDCTIDELVAAIDFVLEILKKQAEKKQKVANKCGFNCNIQPAKIFPDDASTLAFDMFTAGLKFGVEIAKDSQKENKNNA